MKVIQLLLMDDDPDGRIKAGSANWNGAVYKIPRALLKKCSDIGAFHANGIAILLGENHDAEGPEIRICQADARGAGYGVLEAMTETLNDGLHWHTAFVVAAGQGSLGQAALNYLERRFRQLAADAGRCRVLADDEPAGPDDVPEDQECTLDEIVDYTEQIMGIIGDKVFTPIG